MRQVLSQIKDVIRYLERVASGQNGDPMGKVVVIGIDGGTFDLFVPWMEQGHMPALSLLVKQGTSGELMTTYPPLTCPAWWSLSTGKNPGRFGCYHFWQIAPRSYEIKRSKSYGPGTNLELWDILNDAGLSCGIVNNPIMFPPARIRDYAVAGCFASAKSDFTWPRDFRKTLDMVAGEGGYELDSLTCESKSDESTAADCRRVLEKRRKVICHLLAQGNRPDFFLGVITESDRMCHRLLNRMGKGDALAEKSERLLVDFFRSLDSAIADMLAALAEDDHVIVMSDHGFGNRDRGFYINEWLRREGYLTLKTGSVGGRLKSRVRRKVNNALISLNLRDYVKAKVPGGLLARLAPAGDLEGKGETIYDYIQNGLIDWRNTKAVALQDGLIYLNTEDRPQGIIRFGAEYEALRDELIKKLGHIANPGTGLRLSTEIYRREEIFQGNYMAEAPDLYLAIENYSIAAFPNIRRDGRLMGPLELAGHRRNGMVIFKGPHIHAGRKIEAAQIIDLAPTILHIMGVPIPSDMDGKILWDLFADGSELSRDASFQKPKYRHRKSLAPDPEDDEKIRKCLEELGYL